MERRTFLKAAGAAATLGSRSGTAAPAAATGPSINLVINPADPVTSAPAAKWAVTELSTRLQARKYSTRIVASVDQATAGEICLVVSGPSLTAKPPAAAESFSISNATIGLRKVLMVAGRDARGLTYALLELADRIDYETDVATALRLTHSIVEQPANKVRSVLRAFVSEVEDKPWYYDRGAWRDYLTMLATHRFNRFNLSFGIGYDFVNEIRDSYFHFAYPFLLNVPGYKVQVTITPPFGGKPDLLKDDERTRNLDLLQFITPGTSMPRPMRVIASPG
jgi:hypothetical protein